MGKIRFSAYRKREGKSGYFYFLHTYMYRQPHLPRLYGKSYFPSSGGICGFLLFFIEGFSDKNSTFVFISCLLDMTYTKKQVYERG